jgi:hypothetical protein
MISKLWAAWKSLFAGARHDDGRTIHCAHQEIGVCEREECRYDQAADQSW